MNARQVIEAEAGENPKEFLARRGIVRSADWNKWLPKHGFKQQLRDTWSRSTRVEDDHPDDRIQISIAVNDSFRKAEGYVTFQVGFYYWRQENRMWFSSNTFIVRGMPYWLDVLGLLCDEVDRLAAGDWLTPWQQMQQIWNDFLEQYRNSWASYSPDE